MNEQARQLRNAAMREWRQKNPDKIREYNRRYWEKKAESITIADRVKILSNQGYTQREIAEHLNIAVGTVNKYLNTE